MVRWIALSSSRSIGRRRKFGDILIFNRAGDEPLHYSTPSEIRMGCHALRRGSACPRKLVAGAQCWDIRVWWGMGRAVVILPRARGASHRRRSPEAGTFRGTNRTCVNITWFHVLQIACERPGLGLWAYERGWIIRRALASRHFFHVTSEAGLPMPAVCVALPKRKKKKRNFY